jgi:hypothetical protein
MSDGEVTTGLDHVLFAAEALAPPDAVRALRGLLDALDDLRASEEGMAGTLAAYEELTR